MKTNQYQPYNYYKRGFYINTDDHIASRLLNLSTSDFVEKSLTEIENEAAKHGFIIKKSVGNEFDKILKFIEKNYPTDIAEKSMFYFYPFLYYGFTIIAEYEGKIAGCMLNSNFQSQLTINFSQRLMVDQNLRHKHIGELIVKYCFFIALHNKADYNTGIIRLNNQASLQLALNKLGMIINSVETLLNIQYVKVIVPLQKQNLINQAIDIEKITKYIDNSKSGQDFELIQLTDYEGLEKSLNNDFVVIALLKAGIVDEKTNYLFSIPKKMIIE